jgi:hypothetical protein
MLKLFRTLLADSSAGEWRIEVRHDKTCNMFRGGFCDCIPRIESVPVVGRFVARKERTERHKSA